MNFLTPKQIKSWYQASIYYSGYLELQPWVIELWKQIIAEGDNATPPGLVASLAEALTHRQTGNRRKRQGQIEKRIISLIMNNSVINELEGHFLLMGEEIDREKMPATLRRIVEKCGGFRHQQINFSQCEMEKSFQEKNVTKSDYWEILRELYCRALDHLSDKNAEFEQSDLFEILHARLFRSPMARSLYRKMAYAIQEIKGQLGGALSLSTENEKTVALFGEPQTLPLGGYDSITRKGNIASLLPSELAYIDENQSIDYFDYKFLENELLFFKREEGLVFRIRRHITLSLELSSGFEHERHLACLLSFCVVFGERLFSVFSKDVVQLHICFYGYLPSEMNKAIHFLSHYFDEMSYSDKIFVYLNQKLVENQEISFEKWLIGKKTEECDKFIYFDPFELQIHEVNRYRRYGEMIENIIVKMVEMAG